MTFVKHILDLSERKKPFQTEFAHRYKDLRCIQGVDCEAGDADHMVFLLLLHQIGDGHVAVHGVEML